MHVPWSKSSSPLFVIIAMCLASPPEARAEESPSDVFVRVVDRYLQLDRFAEDVRVHQVIEDPETDAPPIRSRVDLRVEIDGDSCRIERPRIASRLVDALAWDQAAPTDADLQLLPHLRLRFDSQPLATFRTGCSEVFVPTALETMYEDDVETLFLDLVAGPVEDPFATFRLEIDVESMLIDRVVGTERLPAGLIRRFDLEVRDRELARTVDAPIVVDPVEDRPGRTMLDEDESSQRPVEDGTGDGIEDG